MSQNALIGDMSEVDLPQAQLNEKDLVTEKQMANYAKSEEFARIREYVLERVAFYQTYLPNGVEIGLDAQPTSEDWRVANRIIAEFKLLIGLYETAEQVVENELSA